MVSEQSSTKENDEQFQQQVQQLETFARRFLTAEALQRYGNVRVAYPTVALQSIVMLMELVQEGKVARPMDDEEYKTLLQQLSGGQREVRIKRK